MDDLISVPCLLDDLMDTGMINDDFHLGGLKAAEGHVHDVVKKSPSHESDSGVSIMSSPEHSIVSDLNDDGASYQALSPPSFENFGNLFDNELTDYLNCDEGSSDNHDTEVASIFTASPGISTPKTKFGGNLSNGNESVKRPCLRSESKKTANTIHENNNSSQADFNAIRLAVGTTASVVPPVKVIKVISAPKNTSRLQVEQEIYEAIEEKNKKNAKQAKINREKKKAYIKSLEDEVDSLKTDNSNLTGRLNKMENHKNALEEEVAYLKNVLANQSTLSSLLMNIPNANVKLSSSFLLRKRSADHDHDYQLQTKSAKKSKMAGVCLHVENENVSLEFCASCSRNSQLSTS